MEVNSYGTACLGSLMVGRSDGWNVYLEDWHAIRLMARWRVLLTPDIS